MECSYSSYFWFKSSPEITVTADLPREEEEMPFKPAAEYILQPGMTQNHLDQIDIPKNY